MLGRLIVGAMKLFFSIIGIGILISILSVIVVVVKESIHGSPRDRSNHAPSLHQKPLVERARADHVGNEIVLSQLLDFLDTEGSLCLDSTGKSSTSGGDRLCKRNRREMIGYNIN